MKNKRDHILIWKDHEELSDAVAHFIMSESNRHIARNGRCTIALSGGNTPKRLYELLAGKKFSRNIQWEKVFLFLSDERYVDHSHEDSNYGMIRKTLLEQIQIPEKNIFSFHNMNNPRSAANDYEKRMKKFFGKEDPSFDIILLGVGTDGHTASLFPGTAVLKEKKKFVAEVMFKEKNSWRLTFTFRLLNKARSLVFLVSGTEKREMMRKVIEGATLPVNMIDSRRQWWFIDEAAAP